MRVVEVDAGRNMLRVRGAVAAAFLGLAATSVQALDRLDISVAGGSEDLRVAVEAASQLRTLQAEG